MKVLWNEKHVHTRVSMELSDYSHLRDVSNLLIYEQRTKPITSAKGRGWNGHRFLCVPHRSWGFNVCNNIRQTCVSKVIVFCVTPIVPESFMIVSSINVLVWLFQNVGGFGGRSYGYPPWNWHSPWKLMTSKLFSFWEVVSSVATLVSGRVFNHLIHLRSTSRTSLKNFVKLHGSPSFSDSVTSRHQVM